MWKTKVNSDFKESESDETNNEDTVHTFEPDKPRKCKNCGKEGFESREATSNTILPNIRMPILFELPSTYRFQLIWKTLQEVQIVK